MSKTFVVIALLLISFLASPAAAEFLATEVDARFVYVLPEAGPPNHIAWAFGDQATWPDATRAWWNITDDPIGTTHRYEIPDAAHINLVYNLSFWTEFETYYKSHFFQWQTAGHISEKSIPTDKIFIDQSFENLTVTSHYTPPNGFNLHGTGLRFTAIDWTLDDRVVVDDLRVEVAGTFRFYLGVPEPSSYCLLLPLALLRSRNFRHGWNGAS